MRSKNRPERHVPSLVSVAVRALILVLPAALLLIAAMRTEGYPRTMLALGSAFQAFICLFSCFVQRGWRDPVALSVMALYLTALGWLWLAQPNFSDDWYPHLLQSVLVLVPLSVFAVQTLTNSGARTLRRARILAGKLADSKD